MLQLAPISARKGGFMPAKRNLSKKKENTFDFQKIVKASESYKSLIYGIITVVILFIVIFLGVRQLSKNKADISDNGIKTTVENNNNQSRATYTVGAGETLWSIAEKEYGDGFKWKEIAKANNITDASSLAKGAKLIIPEIPKAISPTLAAMPTAVPTPTTSIATSNNQNNIQAQKITGNSYTVAHGDYLWEIAIRAYGDGYRWVDIAKANNLTNPNLIFSGNVLKLPR